jgi:hypothetical protein
MPLFYGAVGHQFFGRRSLLVKFKLPDPFQYDWWVSMRDQFGISIIGEVDHRVVIGTMIAIEHLEVTEREHHN